MAGFLLLGSVIAALAAALYVHGQRFRDICDSASADLECRLLCHPEERHARRVLLTISRVPLTLKTCVDMAAGVGAGKMEASVASCIKEAGTADRDALVTYSNLSERLNKPSAELIAAWNRRCQYSNGLPPSTPDLGAISQGSAKGNGRDITNKTQPKNPSTLPTAPQPTSGTQTYTSPGEAENAERKQDESR